MVLLSLATVLYSQSVDEVFGKNRLQYKEFNWQSIVSENFEIYYYDIGGNIAHEVLAFLESNYDQVTDLMGYPPYSRTKMFIYNSNSDLQQSNVGITDNGAISGGEAKVIRPIIEVAHPGTLSELKKELLYKFTKILLDEMLYGGSLKDMLQSNFMNLPEWLTEGAALYISQGWTMEMDDFAREVIRSDKNIKLDKYTGIRAALLGQSIWNYIAERHGKSSISSILNYIKIIRNEERSIAITLGVPFNQLLLSWRSFYGEMDRELDQSYITPDKNNRFIPRNTKSFFYKNVKFSPDGMKVAYSRNDRGRYKLIIYDIATDKTVEVVSGGNRVINQEVNYNMPLMSWVDDNTLGYIDVKKGKYIFWLYDVVSKSKIPRELKFMSGINSLSFSKNGRLGIISANFNGSSDLFLISTRRDRVNRLTNDIFDDRDASFVPGTNVIIFSSNRTTDSLNLKTKDLNLISDNYNLFFYDLDTTTNVVKRITNTISKDIAPTALNENTILYLSDQKGVQNIFKYDIKTKIYSQVTRFKKNLQEYYYNEDTQSLMFITLDDAKDFIYQINEFDINENHFTQPSPMVKIKQARSVQQRRTEMPKADQEQLSMSDIINKRLNEISDFSSGETKIDSTENKVKKDEILNTEDYLFEDEISPINNNQSFLSQFRSRKTNSSVSGPYDYVPLFTADNIVANILFDPMLGFTMKGETKMNDFLENHEMGGGVITNTNLKSGKVWGYYKYRKEFLDYSVHFERHVLYRDFGEDILDIDKYNKNTLSFSLSYPIDTRNKVSFDPIFMNVSQYDLGQYTINYRIPLTTSFNDPVRSYYTGFKLEYVYDNSLNLGLNIKEGTRAKVKLQHFASLSGSSKSFSNFSAEVRHYQKIHRTFSIATRVMYGNFFGNSPKYYLLGGVENWLNSKFNFSGIDNPLNTQRKEESSDLVFIEFIGPIRGYPYAQLYGNQVFIFNAEARLPLIKYFKSGYITSNFLRNLQFIGFFDFGSSWTGLSFLNPQNEISVKTIPDDPYSISPFQIKLYGYNAPWITSYGLGFRTMILGYYAKFDLAWPIEIHKNTPPRLSITLGFDF